MENNRNHRRELGRLGEDIACDFLIKKEHLIIERNLRCGHLEIDIISVDNDGIHFVEVKARKFGIQTKPQDCVDYIKQRRIVQAASRFLRSDIGRQFAGLEVFFDIFAITFEQESVTTEWIPQAYIPIYK